MNFINFWGFPVLPKLNVVKYSFTAQTQNECTYCIKSRGQEYIYIYD